VGVGAGGPLSLDLEGRERAAVMAVPEEERDRNLEEIRVRLAGRGVAASTSGQSRFLQRHMLKREKRSAVRSGVSARTS